MTTFTALGLSDDGHVEVSDHDTFNEARDFITQYVRWNNWGGYYGIAILNDDGEWVETFDAPEEGPEQ